MNYLLVFILSVFTIISISLFLGMDTLVVHLLGLILGVLYGTVTIRKNTIEDSE